MGQLNEAIQIKNVLDFYDIKNFVETGTGQAEVVQTVVEADDTLNVHTKCVGCTNYSGFS